MQVTCSHCYIKSIQLCYKLNIINKELHVTCVLKNAAYFTGIIT